MQKVFLITFVLLIKIIPHVHCQSYLSQNQMNVILNINNYNFINKNYIPYRPYINEGLESTLATRQAQYDYAVKVVSTEIQKLKNLELINLGNLTILENHRNKVISFAQNEWINVDLSINSNFTNMLNYVTWIYSIESVKFEIAILKSVNNEIIRLKNGDPNNFYKSERYKELGSVLNDLKTIDRNSISKLAWDHGLF